MVDVRAEAMTKARTILMVSNHGSVLGGGEISMLSLLDSLDRARWHPIVVVPAEGEVAKRCRTTELQTHVIPLPGLRRPGVAILQSVRALYALIRQTGSQLVHANGTRAMVYSAIAGRLAGIPVLWHVRVADREALLDRILGKLARHIIVNSRAVSRRFDPGAVNRVHCIYNGIDVAKITPRSPDPHLHRSLGLAPSAPVIISVGRFVPYKGYDDLLHAARLVREAVPTAQWLLAGDGELKAELRERTRQLGLQAQVRFLGWREDVNELLSLSDLFVLPSRGEHFGRVLIEAMAMAKPVVATNAGGVPEVVIHGETGLLVPAGQPPRLAESVLLLLKDPALAARLGQAGRRRVEDHFSAAQHVAAVERVYAECLMEADGASTWR
jgi:glycosyltransferase involved in cell wall biosynthesis